MACIQQGVFVSKIIIYSLVRIVIKERWIFTLRPSIFQIEKIEKKIIEKRVTNIDGFSDLLIHSLNLCVCMTLEMVTNDKNMSLEKYWYPAGTHKHTT